MKNKNKLSILIGLRMKKSEYESVQKKAEIKGLDVVSYIRMLVKTHPDRKGGSDG